MSEMLFVGGLLQVSKQQFRSVFCVFLLLNYFGFSEMKKGSVLCVKCLDLSEVSHVVSRDKEACLQGVYP